MYSKFTKLIRSEKGYAFPIVLILMLLGSLFVVPLVNFMGTGLKSVALHEEMAKATYSADAGVENGIWLITKGGADVDQSDQLSVDVFEINGYSVNTTIEQPSPKIYKIYTVASDGSHSAVIQSHVQKLDFTYFFDNAVTSGGGITIQPGASISGNVTDNYSENPWPTADQLADYYWYDVKDETPFADNTLLVEVTPSIGPLYRDGNLTIKNTGSHDLETGLAGTVYVTGDFDMGTEGKRFVLHLNEETIFVLGAIDIGSKCTLSGSGAIIAVGDIFFGPNISSNPDDFIVVMSIEGEVQMNPNGAFHGSVIGGTGVQLQPGSDITWTELDEDLNYPAGSTADVLDWIIIDN
jgi:hypothetical protein